MRDHQAGALKVARRREESERVAAHLPPLNAAIYRFGSGLNGDAFGNGDCWNFVNQAMIFAGANRSALYLFGAKVSLKDALPGDVVQFEKFSGPTFSTGHHSAVLVRNHGDGVITVVHQNARPNGAKVGMWDIDVAKSKGTIIFFRPRK
jgi:cell wall-associated NlpC family hydrolase